MAGGGYEGDDGWLSMTTMVVEEVVVENEEVRWPTMAIGGGGSYE